MINTIYKCIVILHYYSDDYPIKKQLSWNKWIEECTIRIHLTENGDSSSARAEKSCYESCRLQIQNLIFIKIVIDSFSCDRWVVTKFVDWRLVCYESGTARQYLQPKSHYRQPPHMHLSQWRKRRTTKVPLLTLPLMSFGRMKISMVYKWEEQSL